MPNDHAPVYVSLPTALAERLALHCKLSKEKREDVIIDAIALHLDELDLEGEVSEAAERDISDQLQETPLSIEKRAS